LQLQILPQSKRIAGEVAYPEIIRRLAIHLKVVAFVADPAVNFTLHRIQ
jgi:hypothetical protein